VNPVGIDLPRTWLRILGPSDVSRLLSEHAPLASSPLTAVAVTALGVACFALIAGTPRKEVRGIFLLPVVWFGLAWSKLTYAPYFAIAALVVMAEVIPRCRWLAHLPVGTDSLFALRPHRYGTSEAPFAFAIPVVVVASAAALQILGAPVPIFGAGWARLDLSTAPVDLREPLDAAAAALPDGTGILNDLDFGGFCIHFEPRLRVFIDDRYELYRDGLLQSYIDGRAHPARATEEFTERFHLRLALLRAGSNYDVAVGASPRWTLLARGVTANLYGRL
jgi:hypothetical protein